MSGKPTYEELERKLEQYKQNSVRFSYIFKTIFSRHSEAVFSHGICTECIKMYHPKEYNTIYPEEK